MKSAYELAMERLNKQSPVEKLTAAQKKEINELASRYQAKIAELELVFSPKLAAAAAAGDTEARDLLTEELGRERRKLQAQLEEKKNAIRQAK